jgi:phosphoribosyl 1,2-cyclic phosphodiesterase
MQIRCWGARGSLPVSGKKFNRYGGDTTCMEIRSKTGACIIIDAGSGIWPCGVGLIKNKVTSISMLFTHAHLDHIMGFPFFSPVYRKGTDITIYGKNFDKGSYRDILDGIMTSPYFPVGLEQVRAKLKFVNVDKKSFSIGGITITPILLSHPNGGLGFRFDEGNKSFVFLTDNELEHQHDGGKTFDEYAEFSRDADLLIHDAEFNTQDYPKNRTFGHSVFSDAVLLGCAANVKRLGLFHHNRGRTDTQIDAMVTISKRIAKSKNPQTQCFAVGNSFKITL